MVLVNAERGQNVFVSSNAVEKFAFREALLPWLLGVKESRSADDAALLAHRARDLLVALALSFLTLLAGKSLVGLS